MPMETLESLVCDAFSAVPSNGLPPDDFKEFADLPFKLSEFNRMYWVKPVKDMHQVSTSLVFPPSLMNWCCFQ